MANRTSRNSLLRGAGRSKRADFRCSSALCKQVSLELVKSYAEVPIPSQNKLLTSPLSRNTVAPCTNLFYTACIVENLKSINN